jgi:serine/threonine-protein kinase
MPLPRVVEIIRQVGAALDAAHEQGVVHRDLKSENIMVLAANGPDYAKVLDFGIAKIKEHDGDYDPGLTAPDLVIGTPQYMSPEQCSQTQEIDARSDIYSLGVIIYEMLVGHVPFTGPSPTAIMMKHMQEPVPSVLQERSDLSPAIGRVISRAMAKQPGDRYQTVGELVDDLTIAAGIEASQVTPVPTSAAAANRIVVQTKSGVPSGIDAADFDEVTVVRERVTTNPGTGAYALPAMPPPTGVNQTGPALVADPNSQAVEPSPPATGSAEQGIPAGGVINTQPDANVNANANMNANVEASPTPDLNINAEANTNANENANTNSNRPVVNPPLPSPSRPANANENPTAPPPDDKKAPSPKPTQAVTADAPPTQLD